MKMKVSYLILLFFLTMAAMFVTLRGYSTLLLTLTYAAIILVGCAVILITAWLERAEAPGRLKLVLFCPLCRVCLPLVPENNAPIYKDGEEVMVDEYSDFLKRHRGHSFHYLSVAFGPWRKRKSICDPLKNELFLARSEGRGLFLINRSRQKIWQQLSYEVLPLWRPRTIIWLAKRSLGSA